MAWRGGNWLLAALLGLPLALAWDPGEVGRVADGRQMIFTAVALTETGSLGQARSRDLTVPRPGGDSVSRYGLGMSFVQVPAAAFAPAIEARRGPGTSQWLFLVVPIFLVLACGVLAAYSARALAGGPRASPTALVLATIASPMGAYSGMELSEPLQAFALTAAYLSALRAARPASSRTWPASAMLAGAFVGLAVLTKSSLAAVAPFTLTPLLLVPRDRAGIVARALVAGLAPVAGLWLYFEIARFGRPFAGYAGEGFTHPFVDGAWRLLVGPNKGLLLYFPAAAAAVLAVTRAVRVDRARAMALAGAVLPMVALWLLAAPWWAWHGVDGWGPRLLVPGIPLLAVAAALEMERWGIAPRAALLVLCVAVNLPPLLQHPTAVVRYMWAAAWPAVDAETAARVPRFARRESDGRLLIPPDQVLAAVPSASPFILLPWFFLAAHADGGTMAARFNAPLWIEARPDIRPLPPLSVEQAAAIAHPAFAVYDAALADQILRAQQMQQRERALDLSRKLEALAPSGFADALLLESYRLLGQKADAIDWLTNLPMERRQHPAINVVLALWDRDEGKEEEARALLQSSAPSYPGAPVQRALTAPLSAWPADFASMTADRSLELR